jgi:hypothetical protein
VTIGLTVIPVEDNAAHQTPFSMKKTAFKPWEQRVYLVTGTVSTGKVYWTFGIPCWYWYSAPCRDSARILKYAQGMQAGLRSRPSPVNWPRLDGETVKNIRIRTLATCLKTNEAVKAARK